MKALLILWARVFVVLVAVQQCDEVGAHNGRAATARGT
ncbi:hypothetical protein B0G81_6779 [Paraburkholderia sp. BL6665CI2N2]|nr:hypothetical protein B0G81_6779 [Paraburkholderia sp. BL6665CI2N2]